MRIAVVQKCPSNIKYNEQFNISNLEVFNLSSVKVSRLLKRDVDLEGFDPSDFDWVILVGSEALKMYTKVTSVTDYTGKIAPGKNGEENFIASISPAMLSFKPENQPVFDTTVENIRKITSGEFKNESDQGNYSFFTETNEITKYLRFLLTNPQHEVIALDSETTALAPRDGYLLGISISHEIHQGIYADADAWDQECSDLLQEIINTRKIVFHNAKFDMHFFKYHLRLDFSSCDLHDTMLMHYVLDERTGTHGLKPLTMRYGTLGDYDRELDEFKKNYCSTYKIKQADFSYDLIPWDIIKIYAAKDTDATLQLYFKFYPLIVRHPDLNRCYHDLMLPGLHFLTKVENRGVPINKNRLVAARAILDAELVELKKELYDVPEVKQYEEDKGSAFNPNSTQQLRKLLFDYIGLAPTGKLTATKAISTDSEVLKELSAYHPVPGLVLDIRQKSKLKNTYIDKLLPVIDKDGKVRTGFHQVTTTSGRLSSSGKFNMQQLPRDNPLIKGCVVAPEGYKIVAADLTTAEIYYAAVLSQDSAMMQVFINMKSDPDKYPDFHSNIAHMVFGLSCEPSEVKKLYPALRQAAKAISFGILYGSGPSKVAESVNNALLEEGQKPDCTKEKANEYISIYFNRFPKLKFWIDTCHAKIRTDGFIYNFFGRKRRLQNINSRDRGVAAGEVRSGFNAIIQSVSSDHLLLGALEADIEIEEKGLDVEIFALVHDSVVALVREDLVDEYLEILYRNIQRDRGCSIPNCPIGIEQDSEVGGSRDYSCGKLDSKYPEIASIL